MQPGYQRNFAAIQAFVLVLGLVVQGFARTKNCLPVDSCQKSFAESYFYWVAAAAVSNSKSFGTRRVRCEGKVDKQTTYNVHVLHLLGDLLCLVLAASTHMARSLSRGSEGKWIGDSCRGCTGSSLRCLRSRWGCSLGASHRIWLWRVNLLRRWVPSHVYSTFDLDYF